MTKVVEFSRGVYGCRGLAGQLRRIFLHPTIITPWNTQGMVYEYFSIALLFTFQTDFHTSPNPEQGLSEPTWLSNKLRRDLGLQLEIPEVQHVLNPCVNMTWSDEDFIARVARVSRRTHPMTCATRTINRCLGLYRRQWIAYFGDGYK